MKKKITAESHITVLYYRASQSHKTRNLPKIDYTRADLSDWLYDNNYAKLYKTWKRKDFDTNLAPSLDRLDTTKGYHLDNLELVTWKVNLKRAYEDRKNNIGRMANDNKVILQIDPEDNKVLHTYGSISEASRDTGINRGNINSTLQGRLNTAGGYKWLYKDGDVSLESESEPSSMNHLDWLDSSFIVYHVGNRGYKELQVGQSSAISVFLGKFTLEHVKKLKSKGFTRYKDIKTPTIYRADLNKSKKTISSIAIESVPEYLEYIKEDWSKGVDIESMTDKEFDDYFTQWRLKADDVLFDRYGFRFLNISYDDAVKYVKNNPHWLDIDSHVELMIKEGKKFQYASTIPHLVIDTSKPIKVLKN